MLCLLVYIFIGHFFCCCLLNVYCTSTSKMFSFRIHTFIQQRCINWSKVMFISQIYSVFFFFWSLYLYKNKWWRMYHYFLKNIFLWFFFQLNFCRLFIFPNIFKAFSAYCCIWLCSCSTFCSWDIIYNILLYLTRQGRTNGDLCPLTWYIFILNSQNYTAKKLYVGYYAVFFN